MLLKIKQTIKSLLSKIEIALFEQPRQQRNSYIVFFREKESHI